MMRRGVGLGFKNNDGFQRMIRGVRLAERGIGAGNDHPHITPPTAGAPSAHVLVTEDAVDGLYYGIFVYRNLESVSPADDWLQFDDDPDCVIEEVNGEELEVGKRYPCEVVGYFNIVDEFGEPIPQEEAWWNGYAMAVVQKVGAEGTTTDPTGDVWGPDISTTGGIASFTDPSGRFIGSSHLHIDYFRSEFFVRRRLFLTIEPGVGPYSSHTFQAGDSINSPYTAFYNFSGVAGAFSGFGNTNPNDGLATKALYQTFRQGQAIANNSVNFIAIFDDTGLLLGFNQEIVINGASAVRDTMLDSGNIVQKVTGMRVWQAGWTSLGVQGIGTINTSCFEEGHFVRRMTAIADLSGSDDLPTTIAKVNAILAMLRTANILNV